jgi:hypothetical protein
VVGSRHGPAASVEGNRSLRGEDLFSLAVRGVLRVITFGKACSREARYMSPCVMSPTPIPRMDSRPDSD